ncbi:MAG: beta-lactamase family protein [Burkholderiaceae bacterium]|nr:beta-lactamase family protein [Burkholderiaceae bacterium]MCD8516341.1 beta-lactamase family protein [Burkholderiaceae bacterium]MCD8538258.1 beta-lactamase family protein [Burkholderiaceae bacterium]
MTDNSKRLDSAIQFASEHEVGWSRDTTGVWGVHQDDPPPWNRLFGPVHPRGGVSGVIAQSGKPIIQFGEVDRADLTFSVAKAYLALLAGVAYDRGLLTPDQPIVEILPGIGFDDDHNRLVTWRHLLQQTSEWTGTCFDIPDQVDHFRSLAFAPVTGGTKGNKRELNKPGTYWEYNDVRINQLSLALLHLFKKPLPEIFKETIAQRCGLSDNWRWVGYDHAWVDINGQKMQSVPGGSHWGGGVSISANDQFKLTQMLLDNGTVNGARILSEDWVSQMRKPCALAPFYGYLVWLNDKQRIFKSLSSEAYFGMGAGGHFSLVEPALDLVVIIRWIDSSQADEFFGRVVQALRQN